MADIAFGLLVGLGFVIQDIVKRERERALGSGQESREVHFGEKPLEVRVFNKHYETPAKHWALKVGDTWYEIQGAGLTDKGSENNIITHRGPNSKGRQNASIY